MELYEVDVGKRESFLRLFRNLLFVIHCQGTSLQLSTFLFRLLSSAFRPINIFYQLLFSHFPHQLWFLSSVVYTPHNWLHHYSLSILSSTLHSPPIGLSLRFNSLMVLSQLLSSHSIIHSFAFIHFFRSCLEVVTRVTNGCERRSSNKKHERKNQIRRVKIRVRKRSDQTKGMQDEVDGDTTCD